MQGACQSLERGKLELDSSRDARSGNKVISTAEKGKGQRCLLVRAMGTNSSFLDVIPLLPVINDSGQ